MEYTAEQTAIFDFIENGKSNAIVNARAGAAKTTTLVAAANRIPTKSALVLAFNAKIRDELRGRMPGNVKAMTLNGCGFDAWRRYCGKQCRVDKDKNYNLLSAIFAEQEPADTQYLWDKFGEIRKAVSQAKTCGYMPEPVNRAFRPLTNAAAFYDIAMDFEASELERSVIDKCLRQSWDMTREGILDFDDMLLAPAVAGVSFPHYDFVFVDEAQDLSGINHVLLKKIVKGTTRLIAVGDPCQAIYGFRGADSSSMKSLQSMFSASEFFLTTSFRCSKAVCRNAQWRAPDMNSPDWAAEGAVESLPTWTKNTVPDGSAIICRNNAPLFSLAIQLLRQGRYPELRGRDILKTLLGKMKKLGPTKLPQEAALGAVADWLKKEKERQRDKNIVEDQAACMRVFIQETATLGEAIAFAQGLANQSGRIYLMTGHGSKGLEFDNVFFLDQHLIDIKRGQDNNVKYVIETRAKLNLTYITSEGLTDDNEENADGPEVTSSVEG